MLPAFVGLPLYWLSRLLNCMTLSSPAIIMIFVLPSCSSTFITLMIVFALVSPNDRFLSAWKCCLRYDSLVWKSIGSFSVLSECERNTYPLPFILLATDCTFWINFSCPIVGGLNRPKAKTAVERSSSLRNSSLRCIVFALLYVF